MSGFPGFLRSLLIVLTFFILQCCLLQPGQPLAEQRMALPVALLGFVQCHASERDRLARSQLPDAVEIGGDYLSDLGIAADRLAVDAQDNALAVTGHLDAAGADRLGYQLALRQTERRAAQAQTHPVAGRSDGKRTAGQIVLAEPVRLRSVENPKNDWHVSCLRPAACCPLSATCCRLSAVGCPSVFVDPAGADFAGLNGQRIARSEWL